jgi:hypothetical protein
VISSSTDMRDTRKLLEGEYQEDCIGIATGYGLDQRRMFGVRVPKGSRIVTT